LKVCTLTRFNEKIPGIATHHQDMEALRYGIRKTRQGTRRELDGEYKFYTHFRIRKVNQSYTFRPLTQTTGLFSTLVASFLIETYALMMVLKLSHCPTELLPYPPNPRPSFSRASHPQPSASTYLCSSASLSA